MDGFQPLSFLIGERHRQLDREPLIVMVPEAE